ncbi:hypothetical protein B0J11DRAFT_249003 [Dendryphion nanum]|uniref:Vacuolar membrane-associated protein IML1 n=1 Tax=Dendryphion nanum TaxID=256645 RepID=A0A9P9ITE8_9PLEO|nr:hypothetical protein B0J11DRAFT_249003 [Dendryphion nanum]
MSKSDMSAKHTRVQKVCTLWTHDDNFSRDDVVFNGEKFPELPANPGSLIQIIALTHATAVRDFQPTTAKETPKDSSGSTRFDDSNKDSSQDHHSRRTRRGSVRITLDENGSLVNGGREVDTEKSYVFVAKAVPATMKSQYPNLHVSIAERIARVFGFRNRMQIVVTQADEERHSASHVELTFRDEYLARADMWQMAISELSSRTVYRGQKLLFMGTIKATIKNVYINGQSTHSGYFSSTTKPVFRSESARYVLFIQMSKEMWNFDAEGAGEIMFNKVVNGFLPDLFKRWLKINARHLVTIILFTRMTYDDEPVLNRPDHTARIDYTDIPKDRFRDYYRVVVSDMASGDWINILYQLKKEFRTFLRDVSLVPKPTDGPESTPQRPEDHESELIISGKPTAAAHGNVLEAINLAAAQFAKDYIDRDLVRTGISVVVVTAGTGVFEVDYNMLKLTTDSLVGSGIGIDLVCLSPMPLHSVPLFKYRSPRAVSSLKVDSFNGQARRGSINAFTDQDEKTPRQHQPNFGSIARTSPGLLPPIISTDPYILPPNDSDEWRFAMPHWVDISFWSGPTDEIIELSKPKKSHKSQVQSKKQRGTFALRCRMYELQMMGVMENELGDISIAYMEEDPLYPHQLREHSESEHAYHSASRDLKEEKARVVTASGSYNSRPETEYNDELDPTRALHNAWMDAYDQNVFSPMDDSALDPSSRDATQETAMNGQSPEKLAKESYLSSSVTSTHTAIVKNARPAQDVNFHQLMREGSKEMESQSPRGSVYRISESRIQGAPRADVLYRQMTSKNKDLQRPAYHHRGNSGDSTHPRTSLQSTPNDSPAVSRGNTPPKRSGLPPLPTTMVPATSRPLLNSKPAGWFLRQISFGAKKGAVAEATTGVAVVDVSPVTVKAANLSLDSSQKDMIAAKLASTKLDDEIPSQPINIRAASRAGVVTTSSPSNHVARSVETVRGTQTTRLPTTSQAGSVTKDPGSTFLIAGSRALTESIGPKLDISSSNRSKNVPRTLSPTSAIAPWAVLVNPCNPRKNNVSVSNQFRRWQHVFPKRLRTSSVKWKSLCSPAAVPLTNDYFPTAEQLATEYNESPYKITQNDDDDVVEAPKSRESLIRELIAFRLSHGFQIIVGSAVTEFSGVREQDLSNIFDSQYMSQDGDTVFMSVGNTIHQLVCAAGGEVEVKRYTRKPTTALQSSAGIDTPFPYKPYIRTALEENYQLRDVILRPPRNEYNWNFIDTFLAGYHEEFTEILRFWRARFVLIPVELPTVNRRPLPLLSEDSEEEVRLEGIRKLTQVWQRYRYVPPEERSSQTAAAKKKDSNPLAIEYHTRDPSAIVAAGPDSALLTEDHELASSVFSDTEQYTTSNYDIKKLAEELQGEKGIRMMDRRWHWRLHYNCFLGFDLTTWILSRFRETQTRDEAVEFGNQLMHKGLFQHVQKRHQFRDGNFFYQIAAEYRAPRPESRTGWFGMRKTDRSIPSTPLSDGPRTSPLIARSVKTRPSTSDSSSTTDISGDGEKTPTRAATPKRTVTLSNVMRYDVDPRKRSYRPEIISLHYDRLHNPDNCYHIRIDWMNVTAKLIEDAIVTWATSVEKFGLKLVEVPIAEASNIIDHHPFRSPYIIKLARQPPRTQPEIDWDTSHFAPHLRADPFAYHKALLRKLNFVLDMEAASAFPPDVDVSYSWGNPDYKYTQFIHRTGVLLAQITPSGDLLLLANRLAHNRAKDNSKFRPTDPYDHKRTTATSTAPTTPAIERSNPHRSPFSSPLARPVQPSEPSLLHSALQDTRPPLSSGTLSFHHPTPHDHLQPLTIDSPEQIKDDMEAFCSDALALQKFYDEAFRHAPSPSPAGAGGKRGSVVEALVGRIDLGSAGSGMGSASGSLPKRQDSQGSAGSGV